MKIRLSQLRSLIKEEVSKVLLEYEQSVFRRGDKLFIVDDEGNEEFLEPVAGSNYEHLRDGESAVYKTGTGSSYRGGSSGSSYGRGGKGFYGFPGRSSRYPGRRRY